MPRCPGVLLSCIFPPTLLCCSFRSHSRLLIQRFLAPVVFSLRLQSPRSPLPRSYTHSIVGCRIRVLVLPRLPFACPCDLRMHVQSSSCTRARVQTECLFGGA
eukprot:6191304-Pleurochrysis_carterae.AAC.2